MATGSEGKGKLWEDEEERRALGRVVHAFRTYSSEAQFEICRWEANYDSLSQLHKNLLHSHPKKCSEVRSLVEVNQFFFRSMLSAFEPGENPVEYLKGAKEAGDEVETAAGGGRPSFSDVDKASGLRCVHVCGEASTLVQVSPKRLLAGLPQLISVRYVLKNLVRDWSEEGANERKLTYGRIIEELKLLFRDWPDDRGPPLVLVPGCGLARLCVEIAGLGFETHGNEFSYFMLLPSSFMLNHSSGTKSWDLHPWVLSTSNQLSDEDQLRNVKIPDKDPADIVARPGLLSMVAGDFIEVYRREEHLSSYDCVVTSFFIDTAQNVLEYIEVIADVLKMGGFWINLGPLLYHWVDHSSGENSIEISLADVERISTLHGFRCLRKEMVAAPYLANPRSMYQTVYQAAFWTMVKEPPPPPPPLQPPQGGLDPIQEGLPPIQEHD